MQKPINKDILEKALHLIGVLLEQSATAPIAIVVCGGSALIYRDLVVRTTKDLDIVALLDSTGKLMSAEPLPTELVESAESVGKELQLPHGWLNNGPHSIFNPHLPDQGFPLNFLERSRVKKYGAVFKVVMIDRFDQIHLKVYAAADKGGPSYHLDDLAALNPTDDELLSAVRWAMVQDPTSEFASVIKEMLGAIGYGHVIEKI
jgi:hypothetical protein